MMDTSLTLLRSGERWSMTRSSRGSSRRGRRSFSAEFKGEAVLLMRERKALGVSVAQIGRELDVRPALLRAWAREFDTRGGAGGRDGAPGQGPLPSPEEELRRVRRENAVLRQERDFLKKAAAFFAKESR